MLNIKVLFVINSLSSGGAEKLMEQMLPLMSKKIKVDLLLLNDENSVYEQTLTDARVNIIYPKYKKPRNPLNIFFIKKIILNGDYDVVHGHLFPTSYWLSFARKLSRSSKTKYLFTEHNTTNRRRKYKFFKLIDRFIYMQFDLIISCSENVHKNLMEWLSPKHSDKFVTINNGVNIDAYYKALPLKRDEIHSGVQKDTFLITMVSRISYPKDQETVINALYHLPTHFKAIFIGEGQNKDKLVDLAKNLNLSNRVHFLGYRDDVPGILKASDAIVLSTHYEGLSLSSIEGMASRTPFIASKAPGLENIVKNHGLLFDIGDKITLKNHLLNLSQDNHYYDQVAQACYERALDFSLDKMITRYLETYEKLIEH